MSDNIKVLLVGAGYMGKAYAKVLNALGVDFSVVTRNKKTADSFENELGIKVLQGDFDDIIRDLDNSYTHAINAVSIDSLVKISKSLINFGIKNLLVEKPLSIDKKEINDLMLDSKRTCANVYVAYNRRYYSSTDKAIEVINNDGGLLSVNFEFTEWKNKIDFSKFSKIVQDNWLIANSSHVIDLAFFFAGKPIDYSFYSDSNMHNEKEIFVGSGITGKNIFFSYNSNWAAPGRWGIELLTKYHRLYLRPMEKLFVQNLNSVDITEVAINDKFDIDFKPGIYNEVKDFLSSHPSYKLKTIEEQIESLKIYMEIMNGK